MTALVVSQPMFFPWVGLFEQVRLADIFVHYDDVQLPQGRSFITRVQVKSATGGVNWLTVPIAREGTRLIRDVRLDEGRNWRDKHLKTLRHCYARAPFFEEMFALAEEVYSRKTGFLWEFNVSGIELVSRYFGLAPRFEMSSSLGIASRGTQKLVEIARSLTAQRYITGLGALDYLEYDLFEAAGIKVEYMRYEKTPYPQQHGAFIPFVTILDCIANCGRRGAEYIRSSSVYWKEFVGHG